MAEIEPLDRGDVDALTDLADARGWGRTPSRWTLTFDHARVWGIRDAGASRGSGLLAAVSRYEPDGGLAVIGAMLVAEGHERQGIGSALLQVAIDAGGVPVGLYATDLGEPVYRRAGFVDRERIHVHQGDGPPGAAAAGARKRGMQAGPPDATSLALLQALDAETEVGDRSALIADLAAVPGAVIATAASGRAAALAWPQGDGRYGIGPVAAFDDPGALGVAATVVEAARAAGAVSFRIDLGTSQVGLRTWCGARGIPEIRTAPGLVLAPEGVDVPPPSPARRALITQGFG